jgi:hypothetical protein
VAFLRFDGSDHPGADITATGAPKPADSAAATGEATAPLAVAAEQSEALASREQLAREQIAVAAFADWSPGDAQTEQFVLPGGDDSRAAESNFPTELTAGGVAGRVALLPLLPLVLNQGRPAGERRAGSEGLSKRDRNRE